MSTVLPSKLDTQSRRSNSLLPAVPLPSSVPNALPCLQLPLPTFRAVSCYIHPIIAINVLLLTAHHLSCYVTCRSAEKCLAVIHYSSSSSPSVLNIIILWGMRLSDVGRYSHPVLCSPCYSHPLLWLPCYSHSVLCIPCYSHPVLYSPCYSHPVLCIPCYSSPVLYSPCYSHPVLCIPCYSHPVLCIPCYSHPVLYSPCYSHPVIYSPCYSHPVLYSPCYSHPVLYRTEFHENVRNSSVVDATSRDVRLRVLEELRGLYQRSCINCVREAVRTLLEMLHELC